MFISCQGEEVTPDTEDETSQQQNDTDDENDIEDAVFFPVKPGIKRCYNQNASYCTEILSTTRQYQGVKYYDAETTFPNSTYKSELWMGIDSDNRTTWLYEYVAVPGQLYVLTEFIESDPIGKKFTTSYGSKSAINFEVFVENILLQKNLKRTVNGVEYNDVYQARRKQTSVNYANGLEISRQVASDQIYYVAKGIGMIETRTTSEVNSFVNESHLESITGL